MKKIGLYKLSYLAAAISVLSFSGASAYAESTFNISGALDVGYIKNSNYGGKSRFHIADNARWPSYIGLEGTTTLTDKVKVIGLIHSKIRLTDWLNNDRDKIFEQDNPLNASAYLGLEHTDYGTIKVGKQVDPSFMNLFNSPAVNNVLAFTPANADGSGGVYISRAISYTTPTINSFTTQVMYGFGGGREIDKYDGRHFSLSTVYRTERISANAFGSFTKEAYFSPAYGGATQFAGQPVIQFDPYRMDERNVYGASLSYKLSDAITVQGSASKAEYKLDSDESTYVTGTASLVYSFTPAVSVKLGYGHTDLDSNTYRTSSIFFDYFITPKIDVYGGYYSQRTKGDDITATMFTQFPSTNDKQDAYNFGVRYTF